MSYIEDSPGAWYLVVIVDLLQVVWYVVRRNGSERCKQNGRKRVHHANTKIPNLSAQTRMRKEKAESKVMAQILLSLGCNIDIMMMAYIGFRIQGSHRFAPLGKWIHRSISLGLEIKRYLGVALQLCVKLGIWTPDLQTFTGGPRSTLRTST